jgi:predicted membrane channel-forming protein YqfA (hemolysin III family)
MNEPLAVFNCAALFFTLAWWTIGVLGLARGFQIVKRRDYRRYSWAIFYIVVGVFGFAFALAIIYLIGFGFAYRLVR